MIRLVAFLGIIAALVVGLPVVRPASGGSDQQVAVCHVNSANASSTWWGIEVVAGRVIEVSEDSVEAHLAHGDALYSVEAGMGATGFWAWVYGYGDNPDGVKNANCFYPNW